MRIDFHRHLFDRPGELDILLGDMERHKIDKTLLLAMDFETRFMGCGLGGNEAVLKAVKASPDKLLGGVYVDLRDPDACDTIDRYIDQGFLAIKLWPPVGFYPDDPAYFDIYEHIAHDPVPVVVHTGYTDLPLLGPDRPASTVNCSQVINFDLPIKKFPEIPFVLAHCGDPDFNLAMMMTASHANAWLNPIYAADTGWDGRMTHVWESQNRAFPLCFEKMIWGSDNIDIDSAFGTWEDFFTRNGQAGLIGSFYGDAAAGLLGRCGIEV